jgi:hypothetical protein
MNQTDHSYYQERLSAYADGELDASVRARVEEHLRACSECRERLKELEKLGEFVARESGLAESEYWERAAQRIERAVEDAHPKTIDIRPARAERRTSPWWWRAPAIAASVLFLGYVTLHESSILREEVLIPSPSTEPQPTLQTEAMESDSAAPVTVSDTPSLEMPKTPPATTIPESKKDIIDKYVSEPVSRPESALEEKDTRQGTAPNESVGVELNKSIVVLPTSDSVARSASPSAAASKAEKQPEVAASVEAPKQAPDEEEASDVVISLAEEQNYRQKDRDRGPLVLRDTLTITPQMYQTPGSKEDGLSTLQREELAYWRAQRDSLVQKAALLARQDTSLVGKALKYSVAPIKEGTRSALSSDDSGRQVKEQTEVKLLEAWFQICRLTSDSTEVNQGVAFIEQVAANSKSGNREEAQSYLKQLGRY